MTVNVTKPQINLRDKISEVDKPSGIAGEAILRSETPQEVFNYINAGRRNLIINGNMMIDQRNSASSPITSGARAYAVDRWSCEKVGGGAFTLGQSSTAPTGFKYSLLATVTTADTSIASSDIYWLEHRIEGYNTAHLEWGTANAKPVTLSFWVKSSVTGTYSVAVSNGIVYASEYTINTANTWEYKTITISGATNSSYSGSTTTGTGITWRFALACGTNYAITPDTWSTGDKVGSTNQVNWMNTLSNTFYLTGVQLEVGKVATPFEHRSYGEELALCQRYFYRKTFINGYPALSGGSSDGIAGFFSIFFPTTMRASATDSTSNPSFVTTAPTLNNVAMYSTAYKTISAISFTGLTANATVLRVAASGLTAGNAATFDTGSSVYFDFNAEL